MCIFSKERSTKNNFFDALEIHVIDNNNFLKKICMQPVISLDVYQLLLLIYRSLLNYPRFNMISVVKWDLRYLWPLKNTLIH